MRQWRASPVPDILNKRIGDGACLIAASAAALTVGSFTLPVYEIYKVGEDLHWVEGLNLLGQFGINAAVIPHWNNAEGGTHDTRFCYMGEPRFRQLEKMLPPEALVIGLDEHTACIMDLERDEALVRGIGRVIVRTRTMEAAFAKGERFPLALLRGETAGHDQRLAPLQPETAQEPQAAAGALSGSRCTLCRTLSGRGLRKTPGRKQQARCCLLTMPSGKPMSRAKARNLFPRHGKRCGTCWQIWETAGRR